MILKYRILMEVSIFSYNVNGLRAAMRRGFVDWLTLASPDILCLQEIKVLPDELDVSVFEKLGYHHFWYPANKRGYSGVAVFSKPRPDFIKLGMDIPEYDFEGRLIRTDYGDVTLLTVYFPSGTSGDLRQSFKMKFLADFSNYVTNLSKERPNIIISGDVNIAHKECDINFPKKHVKMSGFLPEERAWMDQFLNLGFTDTFRVFNTHPGQYSWWTYRANAREKNLGWRMDYFLISNTLVSRLKSAKIHPEAIHSDHCPVSIIMEY